MADSTLTVRVDVQNLPAVIETITKLAAALRLAQAPIDQLLDLDDELGNENGDGYGPGRRAQLEKASAAIREALAGTEALRLGRAIGEAAFPLQNMEIVHEVAAAEGKG